MSGLWRILAREAGLAWAGGGGAAGPTAFFLACITLGPLAIGAESETLVTVGPGIMGISALLAVLQFGERSFADDFFDGTLELYALSTVSLPVLAFAKVMGQAIATLWALPLIGALGSMMYGLGGSEILVRRGGLLISLIAIPMMIPVLVFAAGAGRAALDGDFDRAWATVLLTLAVSLGTSALMPFGIAAAMRSRLG